jgi:Putative metal-binding motif/Protein of unknown function (DUF1565)
MKKINRLAMYAVIFMFAAVSIGAEDGCVFTTSNTGGGTSSSCIDKDGDGYGANCALGDDCNDNDEFINPGESEVCDDAIDNDCDIQIDAADSDCPPPCIDSDGDGYGDNCAPGPDCNDNDEFINPGESEICDDGFDNDCDWMIDLADADCPSPCTDADGDGYGDGCGGPPDCDDNDPQAYPGAPEIPDDGIDQDCDGSDATASDPTPEKIYVATSGDDANPGTATDPVLTIGHGVELAEAVGGEVLVAQGTYDECVSTTVSLFGGYEASGWTRNIVANQTSIIPTGSCPLAGSWAALTARPVSSLVIDGFTIDATLLDTGLEGVNTRAGLEVYGCEATAVISNNTIIGQGRGVEIGWGMKVRISNNEISAGDYGLATFGIYSQWSELELFNNDIYGGDGDFESYGVYYESIGAALDECPDAWADFHISLVMDNNIVSGGSTDHSSGALFFSAHSGMVLPIFGYCPPAGPGLFTNNIFIGGSSKYKSVGAHLQTGYAAMLNNYIYGGYSYSTGTNSTAATKGVVVRGSVALINNIIDGGHSLSVYSYAAGAGVAIDGDVTLVNNDIWGADQGSIIYNEETSSGLTDLTDVNACAWAGCVAASGNISSDPQLANPAADDYHLLGGSSCIDAGVNPDPWYGGTLADWDFEGDSRPQQSSWDIGPDEYTP